MKPAKTVALDKDKQKAVVKKAKRPAKHLKAGRITISEKCKKRRLKAEQNRGLIYVGHLPHGFYEDEMNQYFGQFGPVTNVKVCRSNKTGNVKGYGYVEFRRPDVAKIAAETMNNYIMFKKRLITEFVPFEKRPTHIFHGKASTKVNYAKKRRRDRTNALRNKEIDEKTHTTKCTKRLTKLQQRIAKIKALGIDYDLKPVGVPDNLE